MREAQIHKRNEQRWVVSLDHHGWSRCGLILGNDLLTRDWNKTTCRNCLNSQPAEVQNE